MATTKVRAGASRADNDRNDRDLLIQVHTLLGIVKDNVDKLNAGISHKADKAEVSAIESSLISKIEDMKNDNKAGLEDIKRERRERNLEVVEALEKLQAKIDTAHAWINKANGIAIGAGLFSGIASALIIEALKR